MKLILLFLIILLILLILRLFYFKEGFQNMEQIEPIKLNNSTIEIYKKFLNFYNPFCENWKKAITSSVASTIQQEPATDPKNPLGQNSPQISDLELNNYINNLSKDKSQEFPNICKVLPSTVDTTNIDEIITKIPTNITPYMNALNWMNSQMEKSQSGLSIALKGGIENFQNICDNLSSCILNNPQFIQDLAGQISNQQNTQITEDIQKKEQILINKINPFLTNLELSNNLNHNISLVEQAQEVQRQAESGELINKINVPGGRTIAKYKMPNGANNLINIKQNNPQRFGELKENYGLWVSLKETLDSINSNL
jgi:hypothetical protein